MIRIGTFVWLALLTLIGVGLYQVELGVLGKESELKQITRQIDSNRDAMHVLDAEWSYLNDPTRLADLARRYTDMSPVTPTQMAGFERLMPRVAIWADGAPPFERGWPVAPVPQSNPKAPPLLLSSAKPGAPMPEPAADDAIGAIIAASQTTDALAPALAKKPNLPTDEQAEADDVIDAILADMKKAQQE